MKVDVQKLIFEIPEGHKHTLPKGVKDSVISLCISMHFKGHLATFDEIENLNIDFELHAMDAQGMPVKSAWHFDFHEVVGDEHFSHPRFHFQFGGKRLRESDRISNNDCDSGELLLMESPRIMHPPLDLTLAIDFLFGNFLGRRNWLRLRSDSIYRKIHGTSKSLYWRPFFDSISGYFDSPDSFKNATDLHPGL
ncbi:hypothetical protein [Marinobacter vinifirmus]|uniref:hypothetical protein n=1 Tax=Marinobacter vinifirmus TaxID=355591 RepID=UPI0023578EB9|nr:hypothetical protein [Marinobacter vinifirmus]